MGGKSSSLTFDEVAGALRGMREWTGTASAIANRLSRGITLVRRALRVMESEGYVRRALRHGHETFQLATPHVGHGEVRPRETGPKTKDLPAEYEGDSGCCDDIVGVRAESLWAERMGNRRWTDDPRAKREHHWAHYLRPPFGAE